MSLGFGKDCCEQEIPVPGSDRMRTVLWVALGINAVMFVIEGGAGLTAGSVSLQADALDFLGDAVNYGLSLFVLARTLRWRAGASLLKGATMGLFGIWILGMAVYKAFVLSLPSALMMGSIGMLALAANVACALMMFRFRSGDSNLRSVWICSRNDAIGNVAVVVVAGAVYFTANPWPDLAVGSVMAALALSGAWQITRQARGELRHGQVATAE